MSSNRGKSENNTQRIRYKRLVQVCNKALEESIKKLQVWEKIEECFPSYAKTTSGAENLAICQQQVIKLWSNLCKVEFDAIFHERSVEEKLNQLDELIEKAKLRSPPSNSSRLRKIDELRPRELIEGNLQDAKVKTLSKLDERLNTIREMNRSLEVGLKNLNDRVFEELDQLQQLYEEVLNENIILPDDSIRHSVNDMIIETRQYS